MRFFKYGWAVLLLTLSWMNVVVQVVFSQAWSVWWIVFTVGGAVITTVLVASIFRSMALGRLMDAHVERVAAILVRFDAGERTDELFAEISAARAEWDLLETEAKRTA